jgi:hypothetical protein
MQNILDHFRQGQETLEKQNKHGVGVLNSIAKNLVIPNGDIVQLVVYIHNNAISNLYPFKTDLLNTFERFCDREFKDETFKFEADIEDLILYMDKFRKTRVESKKSKEVAIKLRTEMNLVIKSHIAELTNHLTNLRHEEEKSFYNSLFDVAKNSISFASSNPELLVSVINFMIPRIGRVTSQNGLLTLSGNSQP